MLYLDSSAIVKLVVPERGSSNSSPRIEEDPDVSSSEIAVTEVVRHDRSMGGPVESPKPSCDARVVPLDRTILSEAASLRPSTFGA